MMKVNQRAIEKDESRKRPATDATAQSGRTDAGEFGGFADADEIMSERLDRDFVIPRTAQAGA